MKVQIRELISSNGGPQKLAICYWVVSYSGCVKATHGLLRGYIFGFVYLNIWACGSFYAINFDWNQKYNVNLTRIKRNYLIWLVIHLKLTLQTWVLKSSFWPGRKHCGLYIQFVR